MNPFKKVRNSWKRRKFNKKLDEVYRENRVVSVVMTKRNGNEEYYVDGKKV